MKKLFYLLMIVLFVTMSTTYASENLEGWVPVVENETATFTPLGTSATIFASAGENPEAWGQLGEKFSGFCGASATFSIDSLSSPDSADVSIGIRKFLGKNAAGNGIMVEVFLNCWQGNYRVRYRVRERTFEYSTLRVLARGELGDYRGTFTLGEDITVGFSKSGCDIVFYCSAVPGLTKVSNCDFQDYPAEVSDDFGIYVYANPISDVTATVSNVNIAYSASDAEALFGGTTIKGYEKGYETALSQTNDAPEQPELLWPNGSVNHNGYFYWNTVLNATWYKIWIGDSTGTAVVKQWYDSTDTDTGAGFSFINTQNLEAGEYTWWLKAWNKNGSQWSDEMSFTVIE